MWALLGSVLFVNGVCNRWNNLLSCTAKRKLLNKCFFSLHNFFCWKLSTLAAREIAAHDCDEWFLKKNNKFIRIACLRRLPIDVDNDGDVIDGWNLIVFELKWLITKRHFAFFPQTSYLQIDHVAAIYIDNKQTVESKKFYFLCGRHCQLTTLVTAHLLMMMTIILIRRVNDSISVRLNLWWSEEFARYKKNCMLLTFSDIYFVCLLRVLVSWT